MKKYILFLVAVVISSTSFALKNTPDKFLVSATLVKKHTKESISAIWKKNHIPKMALPVRNDVDIFEIIYKAPWIDSTTWINCSGIVYIPKFKKNKAVPVVMFGHGTEIRKGRTITDDDAQQGITLGFAADGYLALYPDYYGIGKGDGNHFYQHAWSEGMAFVYMLKAVEELKAAQNIETNGQLFLTGYSQGGHASAAAHKYFEELNDPRFKITASSPMSGAYDMTGEQAKYMFEVYPKPFYLPYLLISYQEAYKIIDTDNVYSVFRSPYDTLLPGFFSENRKMGYADLDKIMPPIPSNVVRDTFLQQYLHDDNFAFKKRLEENNLTEWVPQAPMQLCYCKGDREVNYKNSEVAYTRMTLLGAKHVKLLNLSDKLDHNTCAAFAVLSTKFFFDRYKKHGKNPKMKDVPPLIKSVMNIIKKKEEEKYLSTGNDQAYH